MTLLVHCVDTLDAARKRVNATGRAALAAIGRQWPSARVAWLNGNTDSVFLRMFPVIQVSEGGEIRHLDTSLASLNIYVLQSRPECN